VLTTAVSLPPQPGAPTKDGLPASRQVVGVGLFIPKKTPDQLRVADGAASAIPQDDEHAPHGTLLYIDPTGEGPTNTSTTEGLKVQLSCKLCNMAHCA
jgi:hypothetical protein